VPKKAQFTHERVEYKVFLFDEPIKGSKWLKILKISLTFRFDKLQHLSKSVHTGENSQILKVSNKKRNFYLTEQKAFMRESYFGSGRKINGEWFITLLNVTYHAEHAFEEFCKVPTVDHNGPYDFPFIKVKERR
jgi:hypothetical protein